MNPCVVTIIHVWAQILMLFFSFSFFFVSFRTYFFVCSIQSNPIHILVKLAYIFRDTFSIFHEGFGSSRDILVIEHIVTSLLHHLFIRTRIDPKTSSVDTGRGVHQLINTTENQHAHTALPNTYVRKQTTPAATVPLRLHPRGPGVCVPLTSGQRNQQDGTGTLHEAMAFLPLGELT